MEGMKVLIIGNIENQRTAIMYNRLCEVGFDVTIQSPSEGISGHNADYFFLDEATGIDRNLEKLQNMNLCPEVMIPNMFEYVKESPCKRNKTRGYYRKYWQKGRW